MENSIYVALSHQMALKRQMEIIANNIANQNTTAFKGESPMFQEYLLPTSGGKTVSYVQDYGIFRDTSEGTLTRTSTPTDMAINGEAFFVIETPLGERYTRNGNFRIDAEGQLVTSVGDFVLDDSDEKIELDPNLSNFTISRDGFLNNVDGDTVKLKLVNFENQQQMRKVAAGVYTSNAEAIEPENAQVVQYMLEASNVQPITEMTNMIYVHRAYESSQKLMQTDHDLQTKMLGKLGGAD